MADIPLASLSLTHVHYDPTSRLSYACALLALVPQALCVAYATLLWSSREAEIALMFAGQMASEAANLVLKRLIRQERPPGTPPPFRT
jgi:dolichyldiphosphatase